MTDIKWEEPPTRQAGVWAARSRWAETAKALRSNPGRWALVGENVSSGLVSRINKGGGPFAPTGAFEARGSGVAKGRAATVHARFVGEVSA